MSLLSSAHNVCRKICARRPLTSDRRYICANDAPHPHVAPGVLFRLGPSVEDDGLPTREEFGFLFILFSFPSFHLSLLPVPTRVGCLGQCDCTALSLYTHTLHWHPYITSCALLYDPVDTSHDRGAAARVSWAGARCVLALYVCLLRDINVDFIIIIIISSSCSVG